MLTISKPLNAAQARSYHSREFTNHDQSYYTRGQEVPSEWQGCLAEKWGLRGDVGAEQFARLSEGQHPDTGEQLVRHQSAKEYQNENGDWVKAVEHRAGWDATFSAPKSVSLSALVGGDERVRDAHRESVRFALDELERYVQARIGNNHPAETTGQFVVAKFEHDTSRPVDGYAAPQLHTHAVIFNVTERENGEPRALQPQELYRSQAYATAVYQSELAVRLHTLGYEIEFGKNHAPEIRGYSAEYLEASSPRRQQIEAHLEAAGLSGAGAAQVAAHRTRDGKELHTPEKVLAAHRELAAQHGHQADRVVAEARDRSRSQSQEHGQEPRRAQEAMTYARDKIFEREAVTDERSLLREALRRDMGRSTLWEIRANYEARRERGEFSDVGRRQGQASREITTRTVLQSERDILRQMREGKSQLEPILPTDKLDVSRAQWDHLNERQRQAVESVLTAEDRVVGIQGIAGAGKTSSLHAIREVAEQQGYELRGLAPTSRAAQQLEEAGIASRTLQAELLRGAGAGHNQPRVYVIDEASLASTRQMQDFLHRLGSEDRVILVGDVRQHQGVEAGRPFEQLQEHGMRTAQLDSIVRQRDPELRQTVEQLAKGSVIEAIDSLEKQGRVTEVKNRGQRIEAIATKYAEYPENTLVVAPDNASRRELNERIHQELQQRGLVSKEDHAVTVLTPCQDLTGAERQWADRYDIGDVVRYARHSKAVGVETGEYVRIVGKNVVDNTLTVERRNGEQLTYDPRRLSGVSVYREMDRAFAVGDRIQFTAPDREMKIANRELGTIEHMGKDRVQVRLDSGRGVDIALNRQKHFDHGYAVTSHSSQGLTADRVIVHVDTEHAHRNLINARMAYVSVSRARYDAHIYTNDAANLGTELGRDVSKRSAIEHHPQIEQEPRHSLPGADQKHAPEPSAQRERYREPYGFSMDR